MISINNEPGTREEIETQMSVNLRRGDEPVVFLPIEYINKKKNEPPLILTNRLTWTNILRFSF